MLLAWEVLNLAYYMASFLKLKSILAETNSNQYKHILCGSGKYVGSQKHFFLRNDAGLL